MHATPAAGHPTPSPGLQGSLSALTHIPTDTHNEKIVLKLKKRDVEK